MDFVEICNVYVGKIIIKAGKRIFNSDKIYRSYSDLNFGVTFLTQCITSSYFIIFQHRKSFHIKLFNIFSFFCEKNAYKLQNSHTKYRISVN